jgi:TRAP-type uncharacterized transport system fused permease subunit
LSDLTPPTAIAPYATSAMVGADHTKTEWKAFSLALSGFIVPYIFCYEPSMLLIIKFNFWDLLISLGGCVLGIIMLSGGLIGYFLRELQYFERGLLIFGGIFLFIPGMTTDLIGLGIFIIILILQRIYKKKERLVGGFNRTQTDIETNSSPKMRKEVE